MPFVDANSQLEPLLFQMKQYKNLTKSTIEILPSSGQTAYGPNNKIVFTLPYASTISLEDLALRFTFTPKNLTVHTKGSDTVPIQKIVAPKDVSSLISEIDIKINGQTIQHLTRYNDIVNLLNYFEQPKTALEVLQNCKSGDKELFRFRTPNPAGDGTFVANTEVVDKDTVAVAQNFIINKWYGLLGHRGDEVSSNFIDTNMLGEVTIAFTLASPSVCPASTLLTDTEINSAFTAIGSTETVTSAEASAIVQTSTYELSDVKMSMVRYNLPMSYNEALASNLSGGAKYQIAFNHYNIHSQNANQSSDSIRWNENSRDIRGLIAYFTPNSRNSTSGPMPYDSKVETSAYFKYDNPIHLDSQFQIGSVKLPQNKLKNEELFLELVRGLPGVRGENTEFNTNIKSIPDWLERCFMAYLSLEMSEGMTPLANGGKKLLSGLSSEQLPISCVYEYNNVASSYTWDKTVNVMSLTNRLLVIESGQNCYVEI